MIAAKLVLALNCQDYAHYCTVIGKDERQKYCEGMIVIPLDAIILAYNKDILLCICRKFLMKVLYISSRIWSC